MTRGRHVEFPFHVKAPGRSDLPRSPPSSNLYLQPTCQRCLRLGKGHRLWRGSREIRIISSPHVGKIATARPEPWCESPHRDRRRWSESLHLTGLPGAICTTTLVGSVTSRAVGTASWQAWQRRASRRRYRFFTCTTAHHHRQLKNLRRRRSGGTRIAVSPAKGRAGSGTAASRSRRCEPRRPLRRTGRNGHPGGWPLRVGAARVVGDR